MAHSGPGPLVMLAPMAGITDLPFRDLVGGFGATPVVSEMVASQDIVRARRGARDRAALGLSRHNTVVQLAGREARWMAEAARLVAGQGARRIDINMGCPARKVTNGASGSALMRDPDLALRLIEAVVGAVSIPVSLKMRLGWDHQSLNAAELARRAQDAGIMMITVHARTRCQFYAGRADWSALRAVKAGLRIPLIVNGDIVDAASATAALAASGADGVMIGRGARGRPWLPARIAAQLSGELPPKTRQTIDLTSVVTEHYHGALNFYGARLANRVMRKHLGWYMDAAATPSALRREILRECDPERLLRALPGALASARRLAA